LRVEEFKSGETEVRCRMSDVKLRFLAADFRPLTSLFPNSKPQTKNPKLDLPDSLSSSREDYRMGVK